MPAWFTWNAIKALPWGDILKYGAIIAALIVLVLYIRGAEQAKAKVVELKAANAALVEANKTLETSYKNKIAVMQESIRKGQEREKDYASAIDEIQNQPVTSCAASSPALRSSIRLLRNRHGD